MATKTMLREEALSKGFIYLYEEGVISLETLSKELGLSLEICKELIEKSEKQKGK